MPAPKVRSKDSAQQRLRDHKRQWNSIYKDFSQKLKALKDGMNGRGNAKLGLPPSNIKEPMPAEIGSYLSQLAGEFQTIVGEAESIISEQGQYAKTRRRRKPKGPAQAPNPAAQPSTPPVAAPASPEGGGVVETLSRLGMEKEGSNKITRFWQYVTSIFSSKEFNRQRIGLLSQAADLYYSLLDLENNVLSVSIGSIPQAVGKYKNVKYNLDTLAGTYKGAKAMVERKAEEAGVEKPKDEKDPEDKPNAPAVTAPQEKPKSEPAKSNLNGNLAKIKTDMHLLFNANLAKPQVGEMNTLFQKYESETDPEVQSMFADQIVTYYNETVRALANSAQKKYGPVNVRTIQDIVDLVKKNQPKTAETISDYMVRESHNAISRGLKRKLVKLRSSNKTAPVRLQIDEILDSMKTTVKKLMDNLEKDLSLEELNVLMKSLEEDKDNLKRPMHVLNVFFMQDFFSKNKKKKEKSKGKRPESETTGDDEEMMDYILKRKLKRELSEDYS